jgi:hypothetical protein
MADDLSRQTILIYDHGLFVSWAEKLTQYFGRVLYFCPWKTMFPEFRYYLIGENLPGVERVYEFWDVVDQVDIFFFPDIYDGDLQLHLRSLGKRVWGGAKSEELELNRYETKQLLREIDLPVNPVAKITGTDVLRKHLQKVRNKYVKMSNMRGDMETFRHDDYFLSESRLDELDNKLGAAKEAARFVVEDPVEDAVEVGFDGYTIDGKFPGIGIQGYEIKDAGLIGVVRPYEELPEGLQQVNAKLSPILQNYEHRGFFSTEVRIQKNGKPYLIDPCMRCASPPSELYQETYSNWGEIIAAGSYGETVDPNPLCKYGVEVIVRSDWVDKNWLAIDYPKEIEQWVKLKNMTMIGDRRYIAPHGFFEIGAVVAIDDTLIGAIKKVAEYSKQVRGFRVEIRLDSIVEGIETIRESVDLGVEFSDDPLPTAKEVSDALA